MEMHERVVMCREALGLKQPFVAEKIGINQKDLSKLETGQTKNPGFLLELANFYKTTRSWLHYGEGDPPAYLNLTATEEKRAKSPVPIIMWDQIPLVKEPNVKIKELAARSGGETIDISFQHEGEIFGARVPETIEPGKSNYKFEPGDLLIISPKIKLHASIFVIAWHKQWNEPYYLQYWKVGDVQYFRHNKIRIDYTDDIIICGVVIARMNIFI